MKRLFQVKALKTFLEGEWRLERTLDDRRAGQQGSLSGRAVFAAEGDGLLYREEGRLVIGGPADPTYEGPALQSYRYDFPAPGRAAVSFRDGRFFHALDLTGGSWRCTHLCAPDRYDGEFTVSGPHAWRVVWRVSGPRKDLTLDSAYRRAL
jgi:hypothetical protein